MPLSAGEVRHVAALARLALADDEVAALTEELGRILEHIDRLNRCDTQGVPPSAHALDLTAGREAGLRPDDPRPSLPSAAALANAPAERQGYFLVPRVVE